MKYRLGGHALVYSCWYIIERHIHMKYQLATTNRSWHSTLDKIITLIIWPKSEVSGARNIGHEVMAIVYSCWSHRDTSSLWNISLLLLTGLEILPWTKILIWTSDRWTYAQPERSMPPRAEAAGHNKIVFVEANLTNISAKFPLYSPYAFWGNDF